MVKENRESEITVVACYPGKTATVIRIQNTLEAKQTFVAEDGSIYDIIVGPFLICGLDDEGFVSLTPQQQKEYLAMFRHPQIFVMLNDEMIAIPYEED